jgi:hypothetical protein
VHRAIESYQGVLVLATQLAKDHNELDLGYILVAQAVIRKCGTREDIAPDGNACSVTVSLLASLHVLWSEGSMQEAARTFIQPVRGP